MAKDLEHIKAILMDALEKETKEERKAYLDEICRNDANLRTEVESLLCSHENAGDFLEASPFGPDITLDESPLSEGPGTVIDRYKLLEKIGEGGMAVVYMAEQTEPIRRKVALKIIKLGMDTKSVIARFEAERQALAMMDHPCIAKVLDAGATETGRPYFVMELVTGVSITEYCDKNNLSTKERLELFIQVCNAVQHAHQKGIIHRDIKPTNVMVAHHNIKPFPKVIDFGIAKAINQRLTEKTLFTRYAHIIGTPAYMSPEQTGLEDTDIDIRSDVYSLGTLLYELLTGTTPFDSDYLHSKGYGEIQRIIREEEPTKPSTKISTLGVTLEEIAKCRQTNPQTLKKLIRADLDWIVMKTLEKDRNYRYDSVSEFAADIKRYLNNEPVLVGPPSAWYLVRKFVQRRRTLVATTTAVAAALLIGLIVSTTLFLRMRQALNTVSVLENKVEIDSKLSTAHKLYAQGRYQAALNEIDATVDAQNPNPEAQLLKAQLLYEVGQKEDAETLLLQLTKSEHQIAGTAYYLLAQINMGNDNSKADEYEVLGASILPETAEAYYLQARTAMSSESALQWLDKAIKLDQSHYQARKARALIYYSLGEDTKTAKDVEVLIALRPANTLGYAFRAVLHRESGRFEQAIADHQRAMELYENQTEFSILSNQRLKTYTRMGDYTSALEDARRSAELEPDRFGHQINIFKLLLDLEDYTEAQKQYRSIVKKNYQWHQKIYREIFNHVFDILAEGRTLRIPDTIAQKAPFAQILRTAECYYDLTSKATLLPTQRQGLLPFSFSPDSKRLLCGWMSEFGGMERMIGDAVPVLTRTQGLKIIELESGKDHRVINISGGLPSWSPDGKTIAYSDPDDNICIIPADGGQTRKVATGMWPQWSKDSQHLYYSTKFSRGDLCCINTNELDPVPEKLMKCRTCFVICEEENWIALPESNKISLVDLTSGSVLQEYSYPWPQMGWFLTLFPNNRELFFFPWWPRIPEKSHIIDTHEMKLYSVLNYLAYKFIRSPDHTKLAIGARNKVWIMDIDPDLTVCQVMGELIPNNDLVGYHIAEHTRAIKADPSYPELYLERAVAYMSNGEYERAESDLQQFDALVTSDDHHVGYEISWWLCVYYDDGFYQEAELLTRYVEKLMDRFPENIPSYQNHIIYFIEKNESMSNLEVAERWRKKLQVPDDKGE